MLADVRGGRVGIEPRWEFKRQLYVHIHEADALYKRFAEQGGDAVTYGLPRGTNINYGAKGFPDWVYKLGDAFGLKASTYPGHQENSRNEAGFAPNPQGLNRGIDWSGSVANMQRLADYLLTVKHSLEQVIWRNPSTGKRVGVAGGKDVSSSGYYDDNYAGHEDHVHTRQSAPIPLPSQSQEPPVSPARPQFTELSMLGKGGSKRSRPPINFFIHTEEGNGTAKSLAEYCQGQNGVSYHYTLRDRIVYDVVDTDLYSWSVLNANVFSINLCFAGSKAAWSRAQWLQREPDIEIAAYLAVQDARKYGFSTEVLPPRPGRQGSDVYEGNPRAGISDHNYVTRELGIGNHTDVGPNFPWDVFTRYVNKYAHPTGDGFLMALTDAEQKELLDNTRQVAKFRRKSRSPFRWPGEGEVDTIAGFAWWSDANIHVQLIERLAVEYGDPGAVSTLVAVAKMADEPGKFPDRQADAKLAARILAKVDQESRTVGEGQITAWLKAEAKA